MEGDHIARKYSLDITEYPDSPNFTKIESGSAVIFLDGRTEWEYGPRDGSSPANIQILINAHMDNSSFDPAAFNAFVDILGYVKEQGITMHYNPKLAEILGKTRHDMFHEDNWASVTLHRR